MMNLKCTAQVFSYRRTKYIRGSLLILKESRVCKIICLYTGYILQAVAQNRVIVFLSLKLLIVSADGICDLFESAATSSHVVIAEVLAAAQVVDMHESIFALMLDANCTA